MATSDMPRTDAALRERVAAQDALIGELRRQLAAGVEESPARREVRTDRIEMFSDGVFAIALTLLVLDLRVPRRDQLAGRDLWSALGDHWTGYVSFMLSFIIVATIIPATCAGVRRERSPYR